MGLYDEVRIPCPHCKEYFLEQTKAGDRTLTTYNMENVPDCIQKDLCKDNNIYCGNCGERVRIIAERKVVSIIGAYKPG